MDNWNIPEFYGDHKIVLMVRDPWALFCYWEISPDEEKKIIEKRDFNKSEKVLRLKEIKDRDDAEEIIAQYDIPIWERKRYLNTGKSGGKWQVDIGIIQDDGEYFNLVSSNIVESPRNMESENAGKHDVENKKYAAKWTSSLGISSEHLRNNN